MGSRPDDEYEEYLVGRNRAAVEATPYQRARLVPDPSRMDKTARSCDICLH